MPQRKKIRGWIISKKEWSKQKGQVRFTMGPNSLNQFLAFSQYGVNALRLLRYCETKLGFEKDKSQWIKVDNQNLYKWCGTAQPHKWTTLKKLEEAKLIKVKIMGSGRCPLIKILVPTLH